MEYTKWEEPWKVFSIGKYFKLSNKFYKVINIDQVKVTKSISVSGASTSADISVSEVEPESGNVYGILIGISGPVTLSLKQPAGVTKWGTRTNPVGRFTTFDSPYLHPSAMTYTVSIKNRPPVINVRNPTASATTAQILFIGHKYQTIEVTDRKEIDDLTQRFKENKIPEITVEGLKNE